MEEIKNSYNQKGDHYKNSTFDPTNKYSKIYTSLKHLQNKETNSLEDLKILEIACGGGLLLLEALNQGAAHVTGVDISETMLKSASEVLQNIDNSKYTLKCGDCTDSQTINTLFPNEKFDCIVANWMLSNLKNYESLLSFFNICKSLLKPNGTVSFITGNQSLITHFEESTSNFFFKKCRIIPVDLELRPAEVEIIFLNTITGEETFRVKNFVY